MRKPPTLLALSVLWILACGSGQNAAAPPPEPTPPNPCPVSGTSNTIGSPTAPEFDRDAVLRAMASINVSSCAKKRESGCAQVQLQIEPTGNVSSATACETTLPDPIRACIEKRFKGLSVPAFRDRSMTTRQKVCLGGAK